MLQALTFASAAALSWGAAALASAPASRLAGPWRAMLWMSFVAAAVTGLAALATGPPGGSPSAWALVCVAGVAYTASTVFWFSAVRGGEVSLVVPIVACDGAIAAVFAVLDGETLSTLAALALVAMVFALVLVAREDGAPAVASEARFAATVRRPVKITVLLALMTALTFAVVFFCSGKIEGIDPLWVVAVARVFPLLFSLAVCLRGGGVLPPRGTWRWVSICGVADAAAYVLFILAAREALAIASVISSQYGAVAAVGGVLLLGERLLRRQWIGVAILVCAAGTIAATVA